MKKVLTIIMSVALTVSLVLTMAIFAIKNTVTKETLSNVITENLFAYQNEDQNLYLAYSLPSGIDPSKVDEALSKYGIDHQTFEELMDDPEVQTTIEEYTTEINDFLSGNTSTLNIDESSVRAKVDSIITKYEEKTGKTIDKEQISTVISEAVTTLKENIENPKVTKILNLVSAIIFKNTVLYALIALDIILGLAIVFLFVLACLFRWRFSSSSSSSTSFWKSTLVK